MSCIHVIILIQFLLSKQASYGYDIYNPMSHDIDQLTACQISIIRTRLAKNHLAARI